MSHSHMVTVTQPGPGDGHRAEAGHDQELLASLMGQGVGGDRR